MELLIFSLVGFHLQVDDRRKEAEDVMRRLPLISNMVMNANEKTRRAEGALGSAATDAKTARSMAGEAKEITSGIQQVRGSLGSFISRALGNRRRMVGVRDGEGEEEKGY